MANNDSTRCWSKGYSESDVKSAHENLLGKIAAQSVRMNDNIASYGRGDQYTTHKDLYVKDKFQTRDQKDAISSRSFDVDEGRFHPKVDLRKREIHNPNGKNWAMNKTIDHIDSDFQVRSRKIDGGVKTFNPKGYFCARKRAQQHGYGGKLDLSNNDGYYQDEDHQIPTAVLTAGTGDNEQHYRNNDPKLMSQTCEKRKFNKNIYREHIPHTDNLFKINKLISNNQSINLDNRDIDVDYFCDDKNGRSKNDTKVNLAAKYDKPSKGIPTWETDNGGTKLPRYAGYIPHIKAENLYGNTYGQTTKQAYNKDFDSGPGHKIADLFYETTNRYQYGERNNYLNNSKNNSGGIPNVRSQSVDDTRARSFENDKSRFITNHTGVIKMMPYGKGPDNVRSVTDIDTSPKEMTMKEENQVKSILNDGETRQTKNVVNDFNYRKKHEIPYKAKPTDNYDHGLQRQTHNASYKHENMNHDNYGTNRKNYMKELRDKQTSWKNNPTLVNGIHKMKNSNELKNEFPMMDKNRVDHQKYGMESYNYHNPKAKRGYGRHSLGYDWVKN